MTGSQSDAGLLLLGHGSQRAALDLDELTTVTGGTSGCSLQRPRNRSHSQPSACKASHIPSAHFSPHVHAVVRLSSTVCFEHCSTDRTLPRIHAPLYTPQRPPSAPISQCSDTTRNLMRRAAVHTHTPYRQLYLAPVHILPRNHPPCNPNGGWLQTATRHSR